MKTVGLIGGMSWESSMEYYRIMNETVKEELGGLNSAKIVLYSVNFQDIEKLQHSGDWLGLTEIMIKAAKELESANVDMIVICTNTMHKMVDAMEKQIETPIVHIADQTAKVIKEDGLNKIGLLGTKFTMEQDFYKGRLVDRYDIDVIVPNSSDRDIVHSIIYEELVLGEIKTKSKEDYIKIIKKMEMDGAQGVILGCTEIPLLIKQEDVSIPVYDTTEIHARSAILEAISNK